MKRTLIIFFILSLFCPSIFSQSVKTRFYGKDTLAYKVYFNAMPNGYIHWQYLGRQKLNNRDVDIIFMDSDTKILSILDLESKEKVFLDSRSHLPVKVERDLVVFGKKELIGEFYDQEKGQVRIIKKSEKQTEVMLTQRPPIHNILALIYFFPQDIELKENREMIFNLPTQQVKIKALAERMLTIGKEKKQAYFLIGRGAKRFNLWLDKESRLPLRVEFILPLGKVTVVRVYPNKS